MILVASRILKRAILFTLFLSCYSCTNNDDYFLIEGSTMGTTYNIKYSSSSVPLYQIQKEIDNILDLVNSQMSTYQNDSEISIFNNMPQDSLITISDEFYYVLEKSKYYYDLSKGEFDITVSNLSGIWGFDKDDFIKPSDDLIKTTLNTIGFDKIILLRDNVVSKKNSSVSISLNAIAKGYALDVIAQYFNNSNISSYMIEIGGEVRVKGYNPKGQKWKIAVSSPDSSHEEYLSLIYLNKGSMATSGDYSNFIIHDSLIYSHIISPKTGYPTANRVASATVIARDCIDADAIATILNIVDVQEGLDMVNGLDEVECFIVERLDEGFKYYYSDNMSKYIN